MDVLAIAEGLWTTGYTGTEALAQKIGWEPGRVKTFFASALHAYPWMFAGKRANGYKKLISTNEIRFATDMIFESAPIFTAPSRKLVNKHKPKPDLTPPPPASEQKVPIQQAVELHAGNKTVRIIIEIV